MEPAPLQTLPDKDLYDFLMNCPKDFHENERIRKFQLKNGDYIHCVLWNFHFYISGTDIVKILIWRFQNAGRQIGTIKKFEEGIFSDLRNLKPGVDATLEGPRSEFLEFLYKNGCIRTQKKQKVFFWYSVPHDELFFDALERDLRRDSNLYTYNRLLHDPQQMRGPTDNSAASCYPKYAGPVPTVTGAMHAGGMHASTMMVDLSTSRMIMGGAGGMAGAGGRPVLAMERGTGMERNEPIPVNGRDLFSIKDALFGNGPKERMESRLDGSSRFDGFKAREYGAGGAVEFFGGQHSSSLINLRESKMAESVLGGELAPMYPVSGSSSFGAVGGSLGAMGSPVGPVGGRGPGASAFKILGEGGIAESSSGGGDSRSQQKKKAVEKALDFEDFDLGQFDFLRERCKEQYGRKADNCEQKLFEEKGKEDKMGGIDRMGEIRFVGSKEQN